MHLAVDADVKDVVGVEVTTEEWADCEVFAELIEQVETQVVEVHARIAAMNVMTYLGMPGRDNCVLIQKGIGVE